MKGKRIAVTRPKHKAAEFAEKLREHGAEPVIIPTIAIVPPEDVTPLDRALCHIQEYDWMLLTSGNTVRYVWNRLDALDIDTPLPKLAAVGPSTASTITDRGGTVDLIPPKYIAEGLFAALNEAETLKGKRILLPQSAIAPPTLAEMLEKAGARVDTVTAYRTIQPDTDDDTLPDLDAITFTSSSTAENFTEMFGVLPGVLVAAIGPITAQTCRELGWQVEAIAEPHTLDGLIAALKDLYN